MFTLSDRLLGLKKFSCPNLLRREVIQMWVKAKMINGGLRSKHAARVIFPCLVEMVSDPSVWHNESTVYLMFKSIKILYMYIAYPKQPPYITSSSGLVIVLACRQRTCGYLGL